MRLRPVPEGPKRFGPGSGARSVVTRDHDEDDRTAAISMRCGRSAAGARPHRPRAKQARTPSGPPACFRHAAFGWSRRSSRRTGDQCRGPAQAGRGRDRTSGAPSTPPLAADRASPARRGLRRRRRSSHPSRVGRGTPNLRPRFGRPRRGPAPSRWRDRSREAAQTFSRPRRRLVERRQSLSVRPGSDRAGRSRGARRRSSSPGAVASGNR